MDDVRAPGPTRLERSVSAYQREQAALVHQQWRDANPIDGERATAEQAVAADPFVLVPDELLRRVTRAMVFASARADEAREFAAGMKARELRYRAREGRLRTLLLDLLHVFGRKSFSSAYGTVTARAGSVSAIVDEERLPEEYWRVVTTRTPDRAKILDDLKHGVLIEGATLSNGAPTIQFRRERSGSIEVDPVANLAAAEALARSNDATGREWG
jgi:hypothetical protein